MSDMKHTVYPTATKLNQSLSTFQKQTVHKMQVSELSEKKTTRMLVYLFFGKSSIRQVIPMVSLVVEVIPKPNMIAAITYQLVVNIKTEYIRNSAILPAMKNFLRPYLSARQGKIGRVISIPKRSKEPRMAAFQSGSHIRSSFCCQLSKERSSEQSISHQAIRGSSAQIFSTVHISAKFLS